MNPIVITREQSKSVVGKSYAVRVHSDGVVSCECPAWKFQKGGGPRVCKHMRSANIGPRTSYSVYARVAA